MVGGVFGLVAADLLPVTNWNTLRGTATDRIKTWNKLQGQLNEARQSGDLTTVSEIEKAQYMWVAANGLEQGARLEGMNLAAAHMNRFLYGPNGSDVNIDLSNTFAEYFLKRPWDFSQVGKTDQSLRIGETIIDAVEYPDPQIPFKPRDTDSKKKILIDSSQTSQTSALAFGGLARVRDDVSQDWFHAVGKSAYRISFTVDPESFIETNRLVGSQPTCQVTLPDFKLTMTDIYDWDLPPSPFSLSEYIRPIIYSIGVSDQVLAPMTDYILGLEKKHFPTGPTEQDFRRLVDQGVAGNFDMHAQINLHNVEILV